MFELLGDKTKCPVVEDQLSGVGFSSTRDSNVRSRVTSMKGTRVYDVNFK